jgi:hypothetical protein
MGVRVPQKMISGQITLPELPLLHIATTKLSNRRQEQPLVPPQFLQT